MKGRKKQRILVITKEKIMEYKDIDTAAEVTGVSVRMIYIAIRQGTPAHGYYFDYVIDD